MTNSKCCQIDKIDKFIYKENSIIIRRVAFKIIAWKTFICSRTVNRFEQHENYQ